MSLDGRLLESFFSDKRGGLFDLFLFLFWNYFGFLCFFLDTSLKICGVNL